MPSKKIFSYPESITILHIAARAGLTSVISKLVNDRDVLSMQDSYGRYPIHKACIGGHIETIRLLLKVSEPNSIRAWRDHEGTTPLHLATEAGHTRSVEVLVEEGKADIFAQDSFGFTSLDRAINSSEVESAQLLLRKSCQELSSELDKKGNMVYTLLHQTAVVGYVEGIELLLQARARADIPDIWGNTPLNLATLHGHRDAVKLLGKVTPVDFKCPEGGPLHIAAKYGRNDIVDVLLEESDINPCSRDFMGFTALHWAAIGGHVSAIEKLVKLTDILLPGETSVPSPFYLASCGYFTQVQDVLLRHYETTLLIAPERPVVTHKQYLYSLINSMERSTENYDDKNCHRLRPSIGCLFQHWASNQIRHKRLKRRPCGSILILFGAFIEKRRKTIHPPKSLILFKYGTRHFAIIALRTL
jgi:ankyrin repeat protein